MMEPTAGKQLPGLPSWCQPPFAVLGMSHTPVLEGGWQEGARVVVRCEGITQQQGCRRMVVEVQLSAASAGDYAMLVLGLNCGLAQGALAGAGVRTHFFDWTVLAKDMPWIQGG